MGQDDQLLDTPEEWTPEQKRRAVELHDMSKEDILKRMSSNSQAYDKAILSLSSAGLALSLAAIKFLIPLNNVTNLWSLKGSWILFLITIITSLSSHLIANKAMSRQLVIQANFYLYHKKEALKASNKYHTLASVLNYITGVVFVGAISLVIYFFIVNLHSDSIMSNQKTTKAVFLTDSASVPKMQIIFVEANITTESTDIPSMQLSPETMGAGTSNT